LVLVFSIVMVCASDESAVAAFPLRGFFWTAGVRSRVVWKSRNPLNRQLPCTAEPGVNTGFPLWRGAVQKAFIAVVFGSKHAFVDILNTSPCRH
jgi:hypothetical protein